jgi:hypothetical protein
MANNTQSALKPIFLDELSLSAVWRLLRDCQPTKVRVLEAIRPLQRLGYWLLQIKGYDIEEADFFTGHLRTAEGESTRRASRRESGQIALLAAKIIVQKNLDLNSLNEFYGENTIRLNIAKNLHLHIEYWTLRSRVAQALSPLERSTLWIKKPEQFNEVYICEALPRIDYVFYKSFDFLPAVRFITKWLLLFSRDFKFTNLYFKRPSKINSNFTNKPSVLMLQEDQIRFDPSLRGQPHWKSRDVSDNFYTTFLLKILNPKLSTTEDELKLLSIGVAVLSPSVFRAVLKNSRGNEILTRIRSDRRKIYRALLTTESGAERSALLNVSSLMRKAELMGALALSCNVKLFLNSATHYDLSDGMILIAPHLNIKTIAYQYSTLAFMSPLMMSTADTFLVFADTFKPLYINDGISPREIISIGYLYDGLPNLLHDKALRHREKMSRNGAKFIVCLFDESVQHDRWGLVNKKEHLRELHVLAKKILADPTFGVIVKSQFIFNSPSFLYPDDLLIQQVKLTGRFMELKEGAHRNDIYPAEAAMASDLCISHKFGATAALESALVGVRTVLLDSYGADSWWDEIYSQADIQFESLDLLLRVIEDYRSGRGERKSLGDWSNILYKFDAYMDGRAVIRLRNIVEKSIPQSSVSLKTAIINGIET